MNETFNAPGFSADMSTRDAYLVTVEHGELTTSADMQSYLDSLERFVRRTGLTNVLFDATRDGAPRQGDEETRSVRWEHLAKRTRITRSAVIVDSDMAQARVNMTARSRGVTLQAFLDSDAATRWLTASSERKKK